MKICVREWQLLLPQVVKVDFLHSALVCWFWYELQISPRWESKTFAKIGFYHDIHSRAKLLASWRRRAKKWSWHPHQHCNLSSEVDFYFPNRSPKWVTNVVETTDTRGIWRLRRQHLNRGHLIKFLLIRGEGDLFSDGWWREKKHIWLIWGVLRREGDIISFFALLFHTNGTCVVSSYQLSPPPHELRVSLYEHIGSFCWPNWSQIQLRVEMSCPATTPLGSEKWLCSICPVAGPCLQTEIGKSLGPKAFRILRVRLKHT